MEKNKEFQTKENGVLAYDPIVVIRDVLRRWLVILMVTVLVGVGTYTVAGTFYKPVYSTNTTLVVTTRGSSSTVYSNMTSTSNLAMVFTEMLNSSVFRQVILEETQLQDLQSTITASQVEDTNLLTMRVSAPDPRTAFLVTRAILNNYDIVTEKVMGNIVLEILQQPSVPTAPSNARDFTRVMKQTMLVTAAATCLLIGWRSATRNAVRSAGEARKKLDCTYLGEIPHERKYRTLKTMIRRPKTSVLVSNPATSFRFSEAVRKLRRRVEQHMDGRKVLMVVSLLENEGKSTVAVNLAMTMAKKYDRVLLIDCDLRKPACAKQLHIQCNGMGVRDVLQGKADPASAVMSDGRSGLHMLLQRDGTARSGELVNSPNMEKLLHWARENYDFVILDMPPMSMVTDAERVMNMAEGSLLVVRQNAANAKALNKAIAALKRGKGKLIGCVLNNVYSTGLASGQGQGNAYGGYHRYGGYGRYGRYNRYGRYGRYGNYAGKNSYASQDFEKQD